MIIREFSGKTEEEAIALALETLKLTKDEVEISIENKSSFLGLGKKEVIAKVSYKEEISFGTRSLIVVKNLLEKMEVDAKIYLIEEDDEKVIIEIESPESAIIIGKQGKNLEAIQTLVNVIMNRSYNSWTKVIIDIGNYRVRREKSLKKMALDIAKQVRIEKNSFLLDPMNPFERRIVHMTLKDINNIDTISEGEGNLKRIKIFYKDGEEN